jgi:hypothetical protein
MDRNLLSQNGAKSVAWETIAILHHRARKLNEQKTACATNDAISSRAEGQLTGNRLGITF